MALIEIIPNRPKEESEIADRKLRRSPENIRVAKEYGQQYFDGHRDFGYGGYYYDGRWQQIASTLIKQYSLPIGARVLDIGCAKGFLVHDLVNLKMDAYGIDISHYAIKNAHGHAVARTHVANASNLDLFPSECFDLVVSFNTLHNLSNIGCMVALREIRRIAKGSAFVQVDAYRTEDEHRRFHDWVLTAQTHGFPYQWERIFAEAGYTGDYGWTIV